MKYTLFLLAAMVGAVCGVGIGAEIQYKSVPSDAPGPEGEEQFLSPPCTEVQEQDLYEMCVLEVAESMGVVLGRRLELRGDRELQRISMCRGCRGSYPRGTFCFTRCTFKRRLTVTDTHAHTERLLCSQGKIKMAAYECLEEKIKAGGYECLGNPEDLTIQIFLSE
jgi:hypothetical protein